MSLIRRFDSWITWGVAGVAIGLGLGVSNASVMLMAAGLGGFILYLWLHGEGPAVKEATKALESVRTEGKATAGREHEVAAELENLESDLVEKLTKLRQTWWMEKEGSLFAGGGVFIVGWVLGFVVRGLLS